MKCAHFSYCTLCATVFRGLYLLVPARARPANDQYPAGENITKQSFTWEQLELLKCVHRFSRTSTFQSALCNSGAGGFWCRHVYESDFNGKAHSFLRQRGGQLCIAVEGGKRIQRIPHLHRGRHGATTASAEDSLPLQLLYSRLQLEDK